MAGLVKNLLPDARALFLSLCVAPALDDYRRCPFFWGWIRFFSPALLQRLMVSVLGARRRDH